MICSLNISWCHTDTQVKYRLLTSYNIYHIIIYSCLALWPWYSRYTLPLHTLIYTPQFLSYALTIISLQPQKTIPIFCCFFTPYVTIFMENKSPMGCYRRYCGILAATFTYTQHQVNWKQKLFWTPKSEQKKEKAYLCRAHICSAYYTYW